MKDKEALRKELLKCFHKRQYSPSIPLMDEIINLCATYQDEWISDLEEIQQRAANNQNDRDTVHAVHNMIVELIKRIKPQPPTSNPDAT